MNSLNYIVSILLLFLTSCGVFIKQPNYKAIDESKKELNGNNLKYWDGSQNFIKQSIFDSSKIIIICIPGLGGHAGSYSYLQQYFSERKISTISIDLSGFGHWVGKKGDLKNIGLHICDINQVVDYCRCNMPDKKILLLGESLGTSLCLWYCSIYPAKTDGLILTSLVTSKGEDDIKLKTILNVGLGYTFFPTRPVLLDFDSTLYSNDPEFIRWAFDIDTLGSKKISPRYLVQSGKVIKQSYNFLCTYNRPIILLQGGKDFLSDIKDINKILWKCNSGKIQLEYFPGDYHSLVNDVNRNDVFNKITEWVNKYY